MNNKSWIFKKVLLAPVHMCIFTIHQLYMQISTVYLLVDIDRFFYFLLYLYFGTYAFLLNITIFSNSN